MECEICRQPFGSTPDRLPKLLLCSHTFCTTCIPAFGAIFLKKKRNTMTDFFPVVRFKGLCPRDRTPFELPPGLWLREAGTS
jgi:hypothetical protein